MTLRLVPPDEVIRRLRDAGRIADRPTLSASEVAARRAAEIQAAHTASRASRLIEAKTMAEIERCAELYGLTFNEAYRERQRVFDARYGLRSYHPWHVPPEPRGRPGRPPKMQDAP